MESNNSNKISINIPNYSGPLEILLDLAKTQKVDLADISITKLADQFLEFIKKKKNLNLETASEFFYGNLVSLFEIKIVITRRGR